MSDKTFKKDLVTAFGYNYRRASNELGVSYSECRKYYRSGVAPKSIVRLVSIIARGYLPDSGPWQHFRIKGDKLITPNGAISVTDCSNHHRKSWAATHYQNEYKKIKEQRLIGEQVQELQDKLLDMLVTLQA